MVIKIADGVEIVIDDEKLIGWQQYYCGEKLLLMMKDGMGYRNFEFDKSKCKFEELKR